MTPYILVYEYQDFGRHFLHLQSRMCYSTPDYTAPLPKDHDKNSRWHEASDIMHSTQLLMFRFWRWQQHVPPKLRYPLIILQLFYTTVETFSSLYLQPHFNAKGFRLHVLHFRSHPNLATANNNLACLVIPRNWKSQINHVIACTLQPQ